MQSTSIIQDLYDHNDWANQKLLGLCKNLRDEQLDQPRPIGFGSLRNTLFHLMEAERLWLDRWQANPWRPLVRDCGGMPLEAIDSEMSRGAAVRNRMIDEESKTGWSRVVRFCDSSRQQWEFAIGDMMHHVANHGIHHRAQVLNFLRGFEIKVPAGVDYLFWKLARPSCEQPAESVQPLRDYGLEVATGPGSAPRWDPARVQLCFQYNDWSMKQVFAAAAELKEDQLDRPFEMGTGSLRKNLQHMIDAERWWYANWTEPGAPFPRGEPPRSLPQVIDQFDEVARNRMKFIGSLDEQQAQRVVQVSPGGPVIRFRVIESMLQLCCHGTHHRAQCLNMLRQLGGRTPALDLVFWLRPS